MDIGTDAGVQVGATKNVAWRFHNDNIRCNAVLPGGMFLHPFEGFQLIFIRCRN